MPIAGVGTFPTCGSATARFFRRWAVPILHSPSRPSRAAPRIAFASSPAAANWRPAPGLQRGRRYHGRSVMQQKLLGESHGQRTFAVVLETGDEVMASLQSFVRERRIAAAQITAIGAFKSVVL